MESRKPTWYMVLFLFLLVGSTSELCGQKDAGITGVIEQYKEFPFVHLDKVLEIDISEKKAKLQIKHSRKNTLLVVKESKEIFTDWRDHFNARHTLLDWKAYTLYRDNGRERRARVSDYTRAQERDEGIFHDDNYSYIYTFPNPGSGSKLVSEITTMDHSPEYPIVFFFGNYQPTVSATLVIRAPQEVQLDYRLFGMDTARVTFTQQVKGREVEYRWLAEQLDPYRRDILAPGDRYIIPHIVVQLKEYRHKDQVIPVISSMEDYYGMCYEFVRERYDDQTPRIREIAGELTEGAVTDEEKVTSIFNWVRENIKYIAIEDGDNGFYPRPAAQVLIQRYGDCKDYSSLLTAMMRAVDIPSGFAWVGTRHLPYYYSDMPTLVNDNHMVAVWWDGDTPVILDGTATHHALHDVPAILEGKEVLIAIDSANFSVYEVPVSTPAENQFVDSILVTIDGTNIRGNGKLLTTGEQAANARSRFKGAGEGDYDRVLREIVSKSSNNFKPENTVVSGLSDLEGPFVNRYDFEIPEYVTRLSDRVYINLNLDRFGKHISYEADRKMPVEAEMTMLYRTVVDLVVPEDMQVLYVPEESGYDHELFSYEISYHRTQTGVRQEKTIRSEFLVIRTEEELRSFREMINGLQQAYVETVLLEKQ